MGSALTILRGSAFDLVPTLGERARLVVTDPPYRLTQGGNRTGRLGGHFRPARYANDGNYAGQSVPWPDIWTLIRDALTEDGEAYVMANDLNLGPALVAAEAAGFKIHRVLVWDKQGVVPTRYYMKCCEFAIYAWKGRARPINNQGTKQLWRGPHRKTTGHPGEKPVWLFADWIRNSTDPGDLVLDPFMGTGTAAVACADLGRRFVGIDIDEASYLIASDRMQDAVDRPPLIDAEQLHLPMSEVEG